MPEMFGIDHRAELGGEDVELNLPGPGKEAEQCLHGRSYSLDADGCLLKVFEFLVPSLAKPLDHSLHLRTRSTKRCFKISVRMRGKGSSSYTGQVGGKRGRIRAVE